MEGSAGELFVDLNPGSTSIDSWDMAETHALLIDVQERLGCRPSGSEGKSETVRILDVSHGFSWCFYQFLSIFPLDVAPTRFFSCVLPLCHKSCHLSSFLRSSKTPEIVATFGWVKKLPFESQLIWTAGTYADWF